MKINSIIFVFFLMVFTVVNAQISFDSIEEENFEDHFFREDIEVFFLTNDSHENGVDIFIPSVNQTLSFKRYPFHLPLNKIDSVFADAFVPNITIVLKKEQQDIIDNMRNYYGSSNIAIFYRKEFLLFDTVQNALIENNIFIPLSDDQNKFEVAAKLYYDWVLYSMPYDYEEDTYDYEEEDIYHSVFLDVGFYLVNSNWEEQNKIAQYDYKNDREFFVDDISFLDVSAIDSVYFVHSSDFTVSVHLILSQEAIDQMKFIHKENPQQEYYFRYDNYLYHTFIFDEINQEKEILVPNIEFWVPENLYVSIHGWHETDPNIILIEELYKEYDALHSSKNSAHHIDDNYTSIENPYVSYGVYRLYAYNHSTDGEKNLTDSLIMQVIDDSMAIISTHSGFKLTKGLICLENEEGEHYFEVFGEGLFKVQESKHNIIAQQIDETSEISKSIEIESMKVNKKAPKIEGTWTLQNVTMEGQTNEVLDEKLQFTFNTDGSLIVPNMKGKWLVSPSKDLLIMYHELYDQQAFQIDEWSKNRLVLSISQLYSSPIKMTLIR
jgi:hypothetical protein